MQNGLASKNSLGWWLACLLVAAAYLVSSPMAWQCEGVDEIEYLGLAHSLARGQGYTIDGAPYAYYPPLYPVVLSGAVFRGHDPRWASGYRLNGLLGVAALILAGTWFRRMRGEAGRWAGWLLLFSYYAWSFSTRYLMSEPLYTALATMALLLAAQALEREQVGGRVCWVVGLFALLAATTRFGAVALTGSLVVAAALKGLRTRSRSAWCLALVVAVLAGGFTVFWEARAQVVAPTASESYLRWVWKVLGLSRETSGLIAQSIGEGVVRATPWPERMGFAAARLGQYVLSAVRVPAGFAPLAIVVAALVGVGVVKELRERPWSPPAWYVILSFLMAGATLWVSSYLRYMYVAGPFLFYFFIVGLRKWHACMRDGSRIWRAMTGVAGVIGFGVACWFGMGEGRGAEQLYVGAVHVLLMCLYAAMLVLAVLPGRRLDTVHSLLGRPRVAVALLVILALHAVGLARMRSAMTAQQAMPRLRNLTGLVEVSDWVRANTPEMVRHVAVLPRLNTFLSDRTFAKPVYDESGRLVLNRVRFVVASGLLRDIPSFRDADELRLEEAVRAAEETGRLRRVVESGGASVYEVVAQE